MMKRSILFVFICLMAVVASAVPARPTPFLFEQSDGTMITVRLLGDEWASAYVTADGYVVERADNGDFYYVTKSGRSKVMAHDVKHRSSAEQAYIRAHADELTLKSLNNSVSSAKRASAGVQRRAGTQVPNNGSPRIPIILVQYKDIKFQDSDPVATFENQFNQKNKSCYQYFFDQSRGLFTPQFDVMGVVELANNRSFYGAQTSSSNDSYIGDMVYEGVMGLPNVDFSQYDNDNDHYCDVIVILYAGVGQASSGVTASVWPCQWNMASAYYYGQSNYSSFQRNGVTIDKFAVFNELVPQWSGWTQTYRIDGVGTFCHEFSHCLGLPDYYDTDDYDPDYYGMGSWSLMNSGCYLDNSDTPCGYSGYDRHFMGWLQYTIPEENTQYTLEPLTSNNGQALFIVNDENSNEYYVLENRQKSGWDQYLPSKGLKVDHVTYDASAWNSNVVNNYAMQRMTIIPADNKLSSSNESGDLYPYNGNNKLTDESTPAATLNLGTKGKMGKPITEITQLSGGNVRLWFRKGSFTMDTPEMNEVDASTINDNGFTATWTKVKNVQTYTLNVASAAANTPTYNQNITNLTDTVAVVTGLEPGGTYAVKVRATYTNGQTGDWSEPVTVTLTETPILLPVEAATITNNSFTARWNAMKNVSSYTLRVMQDGVLPYKLLYTETFAKCTADANNNIYNSLDNYLDNAGWRGQNVYQAVGGVRLGVKTSSGATGALTSPAIDLMNFEGKMTVKITVGAYTGKSNCGLRIYYDGASETITVPDETQTTYTILLSGDVSDTQYLKIQTTDKGKPVVVTNLEVYAGDATSVQNGAPRRAQEFGDEFLRTITGITDTYYNVAGLQAGKIYHYQVRGIYADGSQSVWSDLGTVTLAGTTVLEGDINADGAVDGTDLNIMVDIILGNDNAANYDGRANLNDDNLVDVLDLNRLINILLGQ